jgi:DNA (cytosine-5)-methyltransferase 1
MNENKVLEIAFRKAQKTTRGKSDTILSPHILSNVAFMISKIESNKSIVSALVTSLVKKTIDSEQDIRLHRVDFDGGYSARSLDTKYTSPFFKRHFPKYANKESAFLTLATRERIKWTREDGQNLKIRGKKLKETFLTILDDVETNRQTADEYLIAFFVELIKLSVQDEQVFEIAKGQNIKKNGLNINIILEMLNEHFSNRLSSRLPVIAIYSIYEILMPLLTRYEGKKLLDMEAHTSPDKHAFGDIEIYDSDNVPFEIVEIKHNIPITKDLIFDIVKKAEKSEINRYYILTTYKKGFENVKIEKEINDFILQIKIGRKIDIIANGILTTIKYYLRFIDDYKLFLEMYTKNLVEDSKKSTEIKRFHIESWTEILKEYDKE